jgi:hypothetical protein
MEHLALDTISQSEFEDSIQEYTRWASEWDGALPADVFFGIWADLQTKDRRVELHARVVEGHIKFTATSLGPLRTQDNRIYLEDGRELVIQLESVQ